MLAAALLSAACGGARSEAGAASGDPTPASAWVYRCGEEASFVVRFVGDSARIERDLYEVVLPRAISASGARYARDGVVFWEKGWTGRFVIPEGSFEGCPAQRASTPWELSLLLGYDFRAVGQEPGWVVEIDRDRRMHVLADYGEVEFFTAVPHAEATSSGETSYRAPSELGEVVVTVREEPCEDVMSGERFPRSVTVAFAGRRLDGCGAPLPATPPDAGGYRP